MKKVLFINENDFMGLNRDLMSLKPSILEQEKDFDDIFFFKDDVFFCFKARNGKIGNYTGNMLIEYLTNDKNAPIQT